VVQRQPNSLYREAVKTMRHSPEEGFAQLEKLVPSARYQASTEGQMVAELHREFRAEGRYTLVVVGTHAEISTWNPRFCPSRSQNFSDKRARSLLWGLCP
jgi:hypothetical protein